LHFHRLAQKKGLESVKMYKFPVLSFSVQIPLNPNAVFYYPNLPYTVDSGTTVFSVTVSSVGASFVPQPVNKVPTQIIINTPVATFFFKIIRSLLLVCIIHYIK